MLQRAASNAYSWWWASHIRTKQSKWLDQSLQDMEEKVHYVLKMLQEDGDSFGKRAEMYYKKRPELTSFVEESYRAFRALAERYDHLSKELQNANSTLATAFPEQFQMGMDEDDDMSSPRPPRKIPKFPIANPSKVPDVPKAPLRDWKNVISASKQLQDNKPASKQLQVNKPGKKEAAPNKTVQKSGLSKDEALEEIDSLQKEILSLQTVKEFVKSSYQSGLSKYRGIENQIEEKQQKLCSLQDEFGVNSVIEDDVARTLMAEAALKSCEETLAQLQEKQDQYNQEAREENKRIQDARQKLESIRRDVLKDKIDKVDETDAKKESASPGEPQKPSDQLGDSAKERGDSKASKQKKIEGNMDGGLSDSLTVTQLAEKIDQLVNKVINLETAISSQTVLIHRMRTEASTLHTQIHVLEEDKANLIDGTQELRTKVQKMEEKLDGIQDLNRDVESRNSNLQTHFAEARSSLDHLSEQLSSVKPDEDEEIPPQVVGEKVAESDNHMQQKANHNRHRDTVEIDNVEEIKEEDPGTPAKAKKESIKAIELRDLETKEILDDESLIQNGGDHKKEDPQPVQETSKKGDFDWQKMLLSGVEDKEKVLLKEYTEILRNYKDTKKRMVDMQKKDRDQEFEVTVQIRELKSALAKRDEEIQRLRQKLSALQENTGEDKDVSDGLSSNNEAKTNSRLPSIDMEDEDFKLIFVSQPTTVSATEEKLRLEIDGILDENLDFWLRFSTSYHQIEKFKTSIQDLQDEIAKLNEKKIQQEENSTGGGGGDLRSEARPIYKHLKEIQAELTMWTEQSAQLRIGLENRFSSLCNIQEKITNALKEGVEEDEIKFSSHHAAKFQGEVLNMKQENNKVRDELQTGIDHISTLQFEIEKTLRKLNKEFELSGDQNTGGRPRVPLRSFIFGTKQKKQRNSIFSYMHANRKYQNLRNDQ